MSGLGSRTPIGVDMSTGLARNFLVVLVAALASPSCSCGGGECSGTARNLLVTQGQTGTVLLTSDAVCATWREDTNSLILQLPQANSELVILRRVPTTLDPRSVPPLVLGANSCETGSYTAGLVLSGVGSWGAGDPALPPGSTCTLNLTELDKTKSVAGSFSGTLVNPATDAGAMASVQVGFTFTATPVFMSE